MAWLGNTDRTFTTVADTLVAEHADDSTLHDVLAALMDHIGVPMTLAERYRHTPAIRALFAQRGVTLVEPAMLRPHRFQGGPWDGQTAERPRAFGTTAHCSPMAEDAPAGSGVWASADSWPGHNRYAPDGTDGDVVLMTWRLPTGPELSRAVEGRKTRDEEKALEIQQDIDDERNASA